MSSVEESPLGNKRRRGGHTPRGGEKAVNHCHKCFSVPKCSNPNRQATSLPMSELLLWTFLGRKRDPTRRHTESPTSALHYSSFKL